MGRLRDRACGQGERDKKGIAPVYRRDVSDRMSAKDTGVKVGMEKKEVKENGKKALVIAEKPSVARDIARVLGCRQSGQSSLEGERYVVTWGLGHLVELAAPEHYRPEWKNWEMAYLPMQPQEFQLEVIKQTSRQYQAVKALLHRKDITSVIIATDAGREGELVARWILEKAGSQKPVRRLWISSVTDKAIREGFANLKPGKDYENLYDAAVCRAQADWLVGINATRALTCKYNAQLSCGRVQTPTLAIIAERERQIREFQPRSYYGLQAVCPEAKLKLIWQEEKGGDVRCFEKEKIEAKRERLQGQEAVVETVRRVKKKLPPPQLYDLTSLQREADQKFGFSARETLNILQRLYENHKVLTYPRTDSRYLSSDLTGTLAERIQACGVGPYKKLAGRLRNQKFDSRAAFINDAKVSDHHAIIPTEQFVQLEHMSQDERKIYDLVVRRFLAVLYPPCEYEQVTMTVKMGTEPGHFAARGQIPGQPGWKEVYDNRLEEEEEGDDSFALKSQLLPDWKEGDRVPGLQITLQEGKTKPPARFREGTLLAAMENPVAYMKHGDRELARTLGETGGLGTVATRADIIEKLFGSFLLEKKGQDIYLTSKGRQLLELVPEELKEPELTAEWELRLSHIAAGRLKKADFMRQIRAYAAELTETIKSADGTYRHENLTNTRCPVCGKRMLAVKGKNSEMLVCQDRDCAHRITVSRTTNARCPKCHKRMELRGKGDGQIFVCGCGYKEKLTSFQERRQKEGAGVSKRDVHKYLEQQKKEAKEPVNNAFALALAGLKLDETE